MMQWLLLDSGELHTGELLWLWWLPPGLCYCQKLLWAACPWSGGGMSEQ